MAKPTIITSESPDTNIPVAGFEQSRFIDKLNPKLVNTLTIVGFVLPTVGYFWLVGRYSLNVIVGDQWDDLVVIGHSYTHLFDWSSLWAQHNENRIFFPNLVVLLLAYTTHFNVQFEEYISALMLSGATALIVWSHKRRSPTIPWLYYCPVPILAFSIVQYQNALWGFQMAWYLVLLSLAATIALVDRASLTWITFLAAIGAAVVGSFSSLQGLLIWPAGLLLLYHRRRRPPYMITWIAAALVTTFFYFFNFDTSVAPEHQYTWHHPLAAAKFFLFALGDVVGIVDASPSTTGYGAVLLLGIVIFVLAVLTLIAYGRRGDNSGGSPVGVALISVGLLFDAFITSGRSFFGYFGASQSRYTTFDLLVPIGIYLSLLDRPTMKRRSRRLDVKVDQNLASWWGRFGYWKDRRALRLARGVISAVIVIQIGFGLYYGLQGAQSTYADKVHAARVLRNIDHEPNGPVVYYLFIYSSPSFLRKQAHLAQQHHLSLFSSG